MQFLSDTASSWLRAHASECCCRPPIGDSVDTDAHEPTLVESVEPVVGEPVNPEFFPMRCITVKTLMGLDRMQSYGVMEQRGLTRHLE